MITRKRRRLVVAVGERDRRKAEKGPVKLFVRVSPREPRLSDLVEMDVTVESQPGVEIKPPAFGQAVGDFLIRDYSERPPETGAENMRRFHYQFEPAHAGKHLIRSVSIEFVDKRPDSERHGEPALIETDPLEVNVTSELGNEAPSLANLEPMLPPQPVPQTFAIGWLVAAGLAVVIAILAVVGLRRRKRRRRTAPSNPRRDRAGGPGALAGREPAGAGPDQGILFAAYRHRPPVCGRHDWHPGPRADNRGIPARHAVAAVFPPDRSNQLAEFLEAADLIKYAGQQPEEGQIDQAIAQVHEFVNLKPSPTAVMAGRRAG